MNKPLPWYVVLSLYSPSASKLSLKSLICHFSDNFLASGLYNSIQHTTEVVYSQNNMGERGYIPLAAEQW